MDDFSISYATNAQCSSLSHKTGKQCGGGIRGKVKTFSRNSRMRAIKVVSSINRKSIHHNIYFITLTYPKDFPVLHSLCKKHLDIFSKRLMRLCPGCFFFWRIEYQKRGAPHFHCLLFFPASDHNSFVDLFKFQKWLSATWYDIADTHDPAHLLAGTNCQKMQSWNGVTRYVSKYFAKIDISENNKIMKDLPGRFWGIYGRFFIPLDIIEEQISSPVYYAMRRIYKRLFRNRTHRDIRYKGTFGITLFLSDRDVISLLHYFAMNLDSDIPPF